MLPQLCLCLIGVPGFLYVSSLIISAQKQVFHAQCVSHQRIRDKWLKHNLCLMSETEDVRLEQSRNVPNHIFSKSTSCRMPEQPLQLTNQIRGSIIMLFLVPLSAVGCVCKRPFTKGLFKNRLKQRKSQDALLTVRKAIFNPTYCFKNTFRDLKVM